MYSIINSTTWKYCPIAFTWIVHVYYKNMASYCKNHAICIFQKQSKGPRCHHKPLLTEQNRNWRPDNGNIKANLITTRELPNSDRDLSKMVVKSSHTLPQNLKASALNSPTIISIYSETKLLLIYPNTILITT